MSGLLRQLIGYRLRSEGLFPPGYAAWSLLSCVALVTLPAFLRQGVVVWELPVQRLLPFYMLGVGYLLYSFLLYFAARAERGINVFLAILLGAASFLLSVGALYFVDELEYSRLVLIVSIVLGIILAISPFVLNSLFFRLSLALLLVVVAAGTWMSRQVDDTEEDTVQRLNSALYVMDRVNHQVIPTRPRIQGGAITAHRNGFIAATGDGEFYRLDWSAQGDTLVSGKLPLSSPLENRAEFYAADKARDGFPFRVTDLLIRPGPGDDQLFVAHQAWDPSGKCFTMAVSRAALPGDEQTTAGSDMEWTRLYETQPCIELPFDPVETGGRLAWTGTGLLLTVGDHGKDGRKTPALAQDMTGDYGKVLLLDMKGGARIFTSGHRNPQGLLVDDHGQVWVTEHGPAAGDELNRLVDGGNYGWPLVTYGTHYGQRTWPLNPDGKHHGEFTEPVQAFVPGIAISNLMQVGGRQFPRWEGDLLIATLKKETLFRVRLRENRVIYVEPIFVGERVRDLVEAADGRILLWTDDESVTVLSRRMNPNAGEEAYGQCRRCHEPVGKARAIAPNLKGIVGRDIASVRGFAYSPALQALDGAWTEEKLDAYLKDPGEFAPGTTMGAIKVPDDANRAALVRFLKKGVKGN
jgi:cytochrome c2